MQTRPTSVSVIGWALIVIGVISLVESASMMNNPMVQELMGKNPIPIPVQWVMAFTGLAVSMISGGFMLQGKSWARLLYVIWSVCGLLISLATSPAKLTLIPGLLLYGVIVFFLFRPKANEFFAAPPTSNGS